MRDNREVKIILPAVRVNAKMTQQEFADSIGVSKDTVFNWENGKGEPTASALRKMSEISGIPMDFIYCGKQS